MIKNLPQEVFNAIEKIDILKNRVDEITFIEQLLGGLTNRNYKITLGEENYVLRIPGEGTSLYIDRSVEMHNANITSRNGINTEIIYFDEKTGIALTKYIENAVTMHPESFVKDELVVEATKVLKKLHSIGEEFKFTFDAFDGIDLYDDILKRNNARLPDDYAETYKDLEIIRKVIKDKPVKLVPSHNDPLCENFISDSKKLYLIDWEYSGMNDPMWDLGAFSIEAGLTEHQEYMMMREYYDGYVTAANFGRMVINKVLIDAYWTVWAIVQIVYGKPENDYWPYAMGRYERFKKLIKSENFQKYLEAVKNDSQKRVYFDAETEAAAF